MNGFWLDLGAFYCDSSRPNISNVKSNWYFEDFVVNFKLEEAVNFSFPRYETKVNASKEKLRSSLLDCKVRLGADQWLYFQTLSAWNGHIVRA